MSILADAGGTGFIVSAAFIFGLFVGKFSHKEAVDEAEESSSLGNAMESKQSSEVKKNREKRNGEKKRIPSGRAVGSPVGGLASSIEIGDKKGVRIVSEEGKIYAPAAGKIIKLYPAGYAVRMRTEFGAELLIQAGNKTEELEGMFFRPRIIQNEIVGKGKLLIEFDKRAVEEEGYSSDIIMTVENIGDYKDVTVTESDTLKNGEDCLWVCH